MTHHPGALWGIRHPGPAEACTYCTETLRQAGIATLTDAYLAGQASTSAGRDRDHDLPGGVPETDAERVKRLEALLTYFEDKYGESHHTAPLCADHDRPRPCQECA